MRQRAQHKTEVKSNVCFAPSHETAILAWCVAWHAYHSEPSKNNLDAYNAATNEVGQAFSQWQAEQPELFEKFRLWLIAHREDSAGGCWRPVQSARPAG
jgi:hypothetical protein